MVTSSLHPESISHRAPLIQSWASRYQPHLDALVAPNQEFPIAQLLEHLSSVGRTRTVEQVRRHLKINCELAGLEAHRLFAQSQNVINLAKIRHLSIYVERIYDRLLTFYQDQSQHAPTMSRSGRPEIPQMPIASLPPISLLAEALAPLLNDLRQAHLVDEDPRTIGFVTTQFHFTTKAIFKRLKKWDQVLLYPYLQFAEEQVCIPWQEVCQMALRYPSYSPEVLMVEAMIQMSDRIAFAVYQQARQQLPEMRSSRGDMSHPEVAASIVRDTNMFQGYLWLSFLQGDMSAVQNRLLPLCLMVFPSVGVSWEWVHQMLEMMIDQVKKQLTPLQWEAVRPVAEQLLETFMMEDLAGSNPEMEVFLPHPYGIQVPELSPVSAQNSVQDSVRDSVQDSVRDPLEEQAAYRVFQPNAIEETLPMQTFSPHLWSAFK
jgi:Phycobilisome protein